MFQNAWCFEESAPFSYTCRNFELLECVEFEESAPFSYTCRNSQVSEFAKCDESAPVLQIMEQISAHFGDASLGSRPV